MAGIIVADTIQSGGSFIRLNSASQTVATINASGIYANTGNLLIAANGTIGVASITNTAITGTITQAQIGNAVAGTGPAFSAYLGTSQSVTSEIHTKVQLTTEEFDIGSCFDNTTNYRFTPNVAGYYQFNAQIRFSLGSGSSTNYQVNIYKNGTNQLGQPQTQSLTTLGTSVVSGLVYMNGTTDYVELYGYINGTSPGFNHNSVGYTTKFSGFLARAA